MKVVVIGLGRVGIATSLKLAYRNKVIGVDINKHIIQLLNKGKMPFYEPNLVKILNTRKKNIEFTDNYSKLKEAKVIFIAVQTPTVNGKAELSNVFSAIHNATLINKTAIYVLKSTVPPGTTTFITKKFGIKAVSNPEFLEEGKIINHVLKPDFIVIGASNNDDAFEVSKLLKGKSNKIIITTIENAEFVKYGINAFLASKIAFIEQLGELCEKIPNSNIRIISEILSNDPRIGSSHIKPGIGFGGPCLEKDATALVNYAKENNVKLGIVESAIKFNRTRPNKFIKFVEAKINGFNNKKIGILGIGFKPYTDDINNSKPLLVVKKLVRKGFTVNVYDPIIKVKINGANSYNSINEFIRESDFIIVTTKINKKILIPKHKILVDIANIPKIKILN